MSASSFQVGKNPLRLYYFFTRLLPGLVVLSGVGLVFPRDLALSFPLTSLLLVGLVSSFVLGQFVHSLAAGLERTAPFTSTHREHARRIIERARNDSAANDGSDPDGRGRILRNALEADYGTLLPAAEARLDPEAVYVLVRSRIELDGRGRTLQYQALIFFSRNVGLALWIVGTLVVTGPYLTRSYTPVMPDIPRLQLVGISLFLLIGGLELLRRNEHYKRRFADYLVMDFCNLATTTDSPIEP